MHFIVEKNIINLKNNSFRLKNKKGIGLLFHITPSNIPTNFAYSLIFGLLSGNKNVIKVPTKEFPQINIICRAITLTLKKFKSLKNFIKIVRYTENEEFTKEMSLICDGRLIWGGNNTINKIREYPVKEISRDLSFADRNSFCVFNSDEIMKLDKKQTKVLSLKFFNDTFLVDQNACSSPHVVFWLGKKMIMPKKILDNFLSDCKKKIQLRLCLNIL